MDKLISYAMRFVGIPYKWGGDCPIEGLDCSGLVQEILKSVGLDPPGDQTSQGLFNYFEKHGRMNVWGPGSLAFFGKSPTQITHVAFCIDQYRMIEAGGGGSSCKTIGDAIRKNAMVRVRLIKNRRDPFVAVIKPDYSTIGLI